MSKEDNARDVISLYMIIGQMSGSRVLRCYGKFYGQLG